MATDTTEEKNGTSPATDAENLSSEMEQSMDRQVGERIKVVRVFKNHYRCNWWVHEKATQGFSLPVGTIKRSRFVRATKTRDQLLIEDVTAN